MLKWRIISIIYVRVSLETCPFKYSINLLAFSPFRFLSIRIRLHYFSDKIHPSRFIIQLYYELHRTFSFMFIVMLTNKNRKSN